MKNHKRTSGEPNKCLQRIVEMLRISPAVRALILPDMDLAKLTRTGLDEGMRPLRASAAAQVARGVTTIAEVADVLPPGD